MEFNGAAEGVGDGDAVEGTSDAGGGMDLRFHFRYLVSRLIGSSARENQSTRT